MREIKFRCWNGKKMIAWDVLINLKTQMLGRIIKGNHDHYIPMQFTGLKDKNGVDIYEGDLLKGIYGFGENIGEVKRNYTKWSVYHSEHGYDDPTHRDNGQVIGNIYEHPHLLSK